MKHFFAVIALILIPLQIIAENENLFVDVDKNTNLTTFEWINRPIVIFSNSPNDANYKLQIKLLEANIKALKERDVIVLIDTDPAKNSALRQKLRPRGFALLLIGKDGQVKLRKPFPWNVRELSRVIDKMPMRRQEMTSKG